MQNEFWHNAWEKGDPGWRQAKVNSRLKRFWPQMNLLPGQRVFVPLCGDSIDLLWLVEQGFKVVGVELSELAVRRFFADNKLQYNLTVVGEHQLYTGLVTGQNAGADHEDVHSTSDDSLQIICGDIFTLEAATLGDCAAIYDRAATVAMPSELRIKYAAHIKTLVQPGTQVMLIGMSYDQSKMKGPPFSVSNDNVNNLFADAFEIDVLGRSSGPEILGNLADRGLDTLEETVYKMTRKTT